MNKARRRKCRRSTAQARATQSRFPFQGIRLFECEWLCEQCENGDSNHNSWHHTHCSIEFTFNASVEESIEWINADGEFSSVELVEEWSPKEIRKGLNGLFDKEFSWTQLAIARANELA